MKEIPVTNKNKSYSLRRKILGLIRGIDAFGHPINLTYKKDPTFKSVLGGLFTLLARFESSSFSYLRL